jgi:hypothetical protein
MVIVAGTILPLYRTQSAKPTDNKYTVTSFLPNRRHLSLKDDIVEAKLS